MAAIIFENCELFDGVSAELREGVHIRVNGERIAEVSDKAISDSQARRIDAAGRTVMPGLIDAHVHVIATSVNLGHLGLEPAMLTGAKARQIMEAMLRRGFTTIRDGAGADWGLAKAVELGLIDGPRVFFSGRALSQTGGHGDFRTATWEGEACACCSIAADFAVIADGVPAVQKAAREELRRGATQIKIMASGGVASPSDPIWNLQYSDDEIGAAVWEAKSWKTYVMAHAYTPEAISRAVSLGVRSIEHGNLIDAETAKLMAGRGAFLVPTLVTFGAMMLEGAALGLPQVSVDKIADVKDQGLQSLEIARAAGVKIGFGTDLLGDLHRYESDEFTIRGEVLPAVEVLRSATSDNAELLNRTGELGVVATGAMADLLVVDGNPLQDLSVLTGQGENLRVIMKGGTLYKNELA